LKKVLFISPQPFFQWRGSPIRVGFNVRALAELGMEVDLLTLPLGEPREVPGVRIIRVPNLFLARNVSIGPSLLKAAFDVLLLFKGLALALKNRYDVIHCVEDAGAIGVIIAGLTRSKLVFEKHSDPSSYRKGPLRNLVMWLYARVERFTIRHADAVIGTGPGLAEQAEKVGPGRPVHDIFDIPSSLAESSSETTAGIRGRLQQNEQNILITYVGSFAVYQGVDLMFEAIPIVAEKCPDAQFVIIGGTTKEIAARKTRLADRRVENAVVFAGKIAPDDLPDYLAASDILLSPRLAGVNTPMKLLDYLKAGRAIVATDTAANRLILSEHNAMLVKPDPAAFAEGICTLVENHELRLKLGADGKKLIAEKYNYTEFKKKLAACYESLDKRTDS
jgi:glycosyltransferase involved in cell wall biosynthesis